jgi:hypothetical protein
MRLHIKSCRINSYAVDFLLLAGLAFEGNLSGIVVGAYGIAALF